MKKESQALFVVALGLLTALLGGCSKGDTAPPTAPQDQAAAQAQAAQAAQKGMAADAASQQAQQADAARRAAQGK